MRILHVAYSCIPGQYRGGVPKVVYELGKAQAKAGHIVTIVTTNYNSFVPASVPFDQPVVDEDGLTLRYFPVRFARWFDSPAMHHWLLEQSDAFDIVHGHNVFLAPNIYARQLQHRGNVKLFYHIHGTLDPIILHAGIVKKWRKLIYIHLFERENLRAADGLFALSDFEAQCITHLDVQTPTFVVPNGVEQYQRDDSAELRATIRKQYNIPTDAVVILYLGRIVPKKNIALLLEAFATIAENRSNVYLIIAGDPYQEPNYNAKLMRIVADKHLENRVFWPGFVDELKKTQLFAAADIFSHVTKSEGMALAILEAMSAKLAVIVSDGCNMHEAVKSGAVVEIEADLGQLSNSLQRLIDSTSFRQTLSDLAINYVKERHSWDAISQEIVKHYSQV